MDALSFRVVRADSAGRAVDAALAAQVFTLFHDMMLLNKGQIVYFGESERTLEYFMRLGFMPPPNENVADFFMGEPPPSP